MPPCYSEMMKLYRPKKQSFYSAQAGSSLQIYLSLFQVWGPADSVANLIDPGPSTLLTSKNPWRRGPQDLGPGWPACPSSHRAKLLAGCLLGRPLAPPSLFPVSLRLETASSTSNPYSPFKAQLLEAFPRPQVHRPLPPGSLFTTVHSFFKLFLLLCPPRNQRIHTP